MCQTTLYETTTAVTSVPTVVPTTSYHPPYASYVYSDYTGCVSSSGGQCVATTTRSAIVAVYDYFSGRNFTTSVTEFIPVTTTEIIPTATVSKPCSGCGVSTIFGPTTVTTTVPLVYPSTSYHPPYGTMSARTITECVSYSGTQCVSSAVETDTLIIDYFNGRNFTISVTEVVTVVETATVPKTTVAKPCFKRDSELFEKRSAAPSLKTISKGGMAMIGLLVTSLVL